MLWKSAEESPALGIAFPQSLELVLFPEPPRNGLFQQTVSRILRCAIIAAVNHCATESSRDVELIELPVLRCVSIRQSR